MAKFQPGTSGNPGGRPKGLQRLADLARQHTEEAVETLVAIMRDERGSPTARAAAAAQILDRGWGKPTQPVGISENSLESFTDQELENSLLDALAAEHSITQ